MSAITHVLTMTTWSGNEAMLATGERLGFIECTRIPEARSWKGVRYDSVQMAMPRRDWPGIEQSRHVLCTPCMPRSLGVPCHRAPTVR